MAVNSGFPGLVSTGQSEAAASVFGAMPDSDFGSWGHHAHRYLSSMKHRRKTGEAVARVLLLLRHGTDYSM